MPRTTLNGVGNRKGYSRTPAPMSLPNLVDVQLDSFRWFMEEGLKELLDELPPIQSYGKQFELYLGDYCFEEPEYSVEECRTRDKTYAVPLKVNVTLKDATTGELREQEVYLGDFPMMTETGTFIMNGAERVVVSQLLRSPGVYFDLVADRASGRGLATAKVIPGRGAWLEFETSKRNEITVKVDRKRKQSVTILVRALGFGSDDEIRELFQAVDTHPEHRFIEATLDKDPCAPVVNAEEGIREAQLRFFSTQRPSDPPKIEAARRFIEEMFFDRRRYDLSRVGRYKLNQRLERNEDPANRTLTRSDLIAIVTRLIQINNGEMPTDVTDHLGNRRVNTVGELLQNQVRIGLARMEKGVRDRMSVKDPHQLMPTQLMNAKLVLGAVREFMGGSQLSQFMDQINPLSELTHKRRLSALGPGGLKRERAGVEVRDVHFSHYGRICPIETPEGPNIGLIGYMASYAKVNELGFLETPYRPVRSEVPGRLKELLGRTLREDVHNASGELLGRRGDLVDEAQARRLVATRQGRPVKVWPFVADEIAYMSADEDEKVTIAQATTPLNERSELMNEYPSIRQADQFPHIPVDQVRYIDVSPQQIIGVSASLIPFLEHDDANRALMGSNQQRQAVPLIRAEAPLVGTGVEYQVAVDSGQVVVAGQSGVITSVGSDEIRLQSDGGRTLPYRLRKYDRSNQSTCIDQQPVVHKGQRVRQGDVIADSASTDGGELALGHNVLMAYMSWEGGNYEDAIVVSERLLQEDRFTSIHIERHEVTARETKLGAEEITADIPNVGPEARKNLDENGVIRIGAEVTGGDILVGKVSPKGETVLSPEEKLLRAIFGEKVRDVKDTSKRLPNGQRGKVVDVKVFDRKEHNDLPAGTEKVLHINVAQQRKLMEGDKMSGRHGNKGVISKIIPVEDMPFLADGTPVDIILNPIGVQGRLNIGQILENHLGWAADRIGFKVATPAFDGARQEQIEGELARAWLTDQAWARVAERGWELLAADEAIPEAALTDDDDVRFTYLEQWLQPDEYDLERVLSDYAYARRAAVREWLKEEGYDPEVILPQDYTHQRTTAADDALAVEVACREWLQQHGRVPAGAAGEELRAAAVRQALASGLPLPITGKQILYDGKTGEPYAEPVTVGVSFMLKLLHLVEDKVHARSTGPYSLVTQQPLGGKAQNGGQRFGEMEVWALEAYGASHTLQEMLTIKSDDTIGRVNAYQSIVKGEEIQNPGIPESFRVLVKELQSLGLAVEVTNDKQERMQFGKVEETHRLPNLGIGLNLPKLPAF